MNETTDQQLRYARNWNTRTCGECGHFHQYNGEPRGDCFRSPPKTQGNLKHPVVKENDRACGEFTDEALPTGRTKVNPETPGAAAKAARNLKGP